MPAENRDEHRMRQLLTAASQDLESSPALNAESIIARARRRRRPRQLAVGGASALVLVAAFAIAVPAITDPGNVGGPATMDASTLAEPDIEQRGHELESEAHSCADLGCASPLETMVINGLDVALEARSVTGAGGEWRIDAEIVLANTSATPSTVDLDAAVFTLEQEGATVGAHYGSVDGSPATRAPGESRTYTVNFEPLPCGLSHDLSGEFELWVAIVIDGQTVTSAVTIISS